MKVYAIIITVMFTAALVLAGCDSQEIQSVKSQNIPSDIVLKNEKAQTNEKSGNDKSESVGYEVIKEVYEDKENNIKISYPQISGYKGELVMGYMNQTLKKVTLMYGKKDTYRDIKIDYIITKMDSNIISILFKGTGKVSGVKEINIQQSVNLDIKTSNPIEFNNLIKDQESGTAVRQIINQKAKAMGLKSGAEFERVRIYFEGENVVFFYMPADDSTSNFIEISISAKELKSHVNTNFGEKPVS